MYIVAIIEARMNSSRLPGKVLMKAAGIPMLKHLVDRLKKVKLIDEIVIATTTNPKDIEIINFSKKKKIKFYKGSEEDVMSRVIEAAEKVNADLIVEITGDCPIVDTSLVSQMINIFLNNNVDYVNNVDIRSYPDGMDVQVFKLETLKRSSVLTNNQKDREHVTLHIRKNPQLFSRINVVAPDELFWPKLGLTLDEYEDFILLKKIIENFFAKKKENFSCRDVLDFLNENEELLKINKKVKRKGDN